MLLVYAQSVLVRSIEVVYIGMGAARNTTRYSSSLLTYTVHLQCTLYSTVQYIRNENDYLVQFAKTLKRV